MHELSIAQGILDIVQQYVPEDQAAGVRSVRVRIGPLSGIVPESLDFSFGAIVAGTPWRDAKLDLVLVPARLRCNGCTRESEARELVFCCPECGGHDIQMVSGAELDVVEIETEGT